MPLEQTADICLPPELLHCDDNMNNDRAITEKCSIDLQSHTSLSVPLQHQQCDCVEVIPPMTPTTSQQCKTNTHPFQSYRKRALRKKSLNSFSRRNRSKLVSLIFVPWNVISIEIESNTYFTFLFDRRHLFRRNGLLPYWNIRLILLLSPKRLYQKGSIIGTTTLNQTITVESRLHRLLIWIIRSPPITRPMWRTKMIFTCLLHLHHRH